MGRGHQLSHLMTQLIVKVRVCVHTHSMCVWSVDPIWMLTVTLLRFNAPSLLYVSVYEGHTYNVTGVCACGFYVLTKNGNCMVAIFYCRHHQHGWRWWYTHTSQLYWRKLDVCQERFKRFFFCLSASTDKLIFYAAPFCVKIRVHTLNLFSFSSLDASNWTFGTDAPRSR